MSELETQLALARRQLRATQQVSDALYSVTDIDSLQRLALQTAMDVVEADAGSLLLYEADNNALVFRHVAGPVAESLRGTSLDLSLGLGIAGQVFTTGEARLTHDVGQDADHIGTVDALTGYQTRSLMTVPLRRLDGNPVGVVQLVNKRTGRFDAHDVAVIDVIGSLVVMAVQNAILAERAKLAAVARSIGEISHDIGNMLTHVLPYVQSLEGCIVDVRAGKPQAVEGLEEFYQEVVENVREGVEQVQERTKEIARAVKGEVAPMVFEQGRPYQNALRVVKSLEAAAQRKGVRLTATGDKDLVVTYDRSRIYNALYNLADNAIIETPPGGDVSVGVVAVPQEDAYDLVVRDTGVGMPEEVRLALFTDAARSTKPGGTGLGTRIVRRIVEQHGGTAAVVSAPGEGTAITLRLPALPPLTVDGALSLSARREY